MFIRYLKAKIWIILLLAVFGFIFFYRLGLNTLQSWDEAWYGSIAREMSINNDYMNMKYNDDPFFDHPPMGFWLMAITYKLFGINEFTTRLPSATLGLMSIILIYFITMNLFKKQTIAFTASAILGTSVWYTLRVRSGNLDSIFVFFTLLTIYLSIKSARNFNYFPVVMISFACLILSKTLGGITVLPLIIYWNFFSFFKSRRNPVFFLLGIVLFIIITLPWYQLHIHKYPDFINYHFVNIGLKNQSIDSQVNLHLQQPLFYLHMGIRKWYKIWQLALAILAVYVVFLIKKVIQGRSLKKNKKIVPYFFILFWNITILFPFIINSKTEIWHLIPVYAPISIIIAVVFFDLEQLLKTKVMKVLKINIPTSAITLTCLIFFLMLTIIQIKNFWVEIIPSTQYINDQVDISKKLAKYEKTIYVDHDYLPVAVFYSNRKIDTLVFESDDITTFTNLFAREPASSAVTQNWVIDDLKKKKMIVKVLEKNNTYSAITGL